MHDRLGANAVPVQLPIGAEGDFAGIIDLVGMKAVRYLDDLGKEQEVVDIPAEMLDEAKEAREVLIDAVTHFDDELAEKYLEEGDVPIEQLKAAIRKAVLAID
jgi:elongation factor G